MDQKFHTWTTGHAVLKANRLQAAIDLLPVLDQLSLTAEKEAFLWGLSEISTDSSHCLFTKVMCEKIWIQDKKLMWDDSWIPPPNHQIPLPPHPRTPADALAPGPWYDLLWELTMAAKTTSTWVAELER
ncbi:hypothetical protein HDU81_007482 [Chytriomyces hyalinus]|nr:hypothetical protein HDU81_007482 [Chytriomyces hyalinus]